MNDLPNPERIPYLNRECHRIFAEYDPDEKSAVYQHAKILELMKRDFGQGCDQETDEDPVSSNET